MQSFETKSSRPRPKSLETETETRPDTFETETETTKTKSRDSITAPHVGPGDASKSQLNQASQNRTGLIFG